MKGHSYVNNKSIFIIYNILTPNSEIIEACSTELTIFKVACVSKFQYSKGEYFLTILQKNQ
jgi:hypothetical protein